MKRALVAVALLFAACPPEPPPGEPMGNWAVQLAPVERACELPEVSGAAFGFDMVLTRDPDSDAAWVTLNSYTRTATFDGQYFSSEGEAPRVFTQCAQCRTRLIETMHFAVLSRSQLDALKGECPAEPLDGGVPAPDDAGITAPERTAQGYDGVRLCGEMMTRVKSEGTEDGGACDPMCDGCTVRYQLQGGRR